MPSFTSSPRQRLQYKKLAPHLPPDLAYEYRPQVIDALSDYADCFYIPGDKLGASRMLEYPIITENNAIINIPQPTLSKKSWANIEILIKDLLDQGIIRKSTSLYNFPIDVLEKKPDPRGIVKYRLIIDMSAIHECYGTEGPSIPSIIDVVDELYGEKVFSVFDLASASYQIGLLPDHCHKAAFTTKSGHYEFLRMPVGVRNAHRYTQRLMNGMLKDMKGKAFVCHDDILVHAPSIEEHAVRLRQVLARVRQAGLKLQPGKCQLFKSRVTYLGHNITDKGWGPDLVKIVSVRAQKLPGKREDLENFLNFCRTYSLFIPEQANMAKPLNDLLVRELMSDCFKYNIAEQNAFSQLQGILMKNLLLQYPNWYNKFEIRPRYLENGFGATLRQPKFRAEPSNVIAHVSKLYQYAEVKYTKAQKRSLAKNWAKEQFGRYLEYWSLTR